MPDTAARVALVVRRYELARFTIAVTGIDLTGVAMAMQVRLQRGTPGAPLIQLGVVDTLAAEGLKVDSVTVTNGIPTSIIKGRINKTTMDDATKVPFAGELGSDTVLAYAMQWTLGGDAQTRIEGDFVVRDSAYGSDNAPANRPASYGATSGIAGATSGSLQFGDQVISVSIDGAEQVGLLLGKSIDEADRAERARNGAELAAQALARGSREASYGLDPAAGSDSDPYTGGGPTTVVSLDPLGAGLLSKIELFAAEPGVRTPALFSGAGTNLKREWTGSPTNVATTGEQVVQVPQLPTVVEGWFLGFDYPAGGGSIRTKAGGAYARHEGIAGEGIQAYAVTGFTMQVLATVITTAVQVEAEDRRLGDGPGGRAFSVQRSSLPAFDTAYAPGMQNVTGRGVTVVDGISVGRNGIVDHIWVDIASGSGPFDIGVFNETDRNTPGAFKYRAVLRRTVHAVRSGRLHLYAPQDFVAFEVQRSQHLGVIIPAGGPSVVQSFGVSGGASQTVAGDPGPAEFTTAGSPAGLQMQAAIVHDLTAMLLPWRGRKLAVLGDSIAYAALWLPRLLEDTGFVLDASIGHTNDGAADGNKGSPGQKLRTMADTNPASGVAINFANSDAAIIMTAINDILNGSATLGAATDPAAADTIYGGVRRVVQQIHSTNPRTLPFLVGPLNTQRPASDDAGPFAYGATNANGLNVTNVNAAMEDACHRLGVPFFSLQREMGVNDLNILEWTDEGIHPSQSLAERLGAQLSTFVNRSQPRT